jgi:hypothetical protein
VTAGASTLGPISQVQNPRPPVPGWSQLQVLDVTNTQLTDAGCMQLAAELAAAALLAAGQRAAGSVGSGLRVLHVGSSVCKLGRKALAGLCQSTSFQQLKLQVSCSGCSAPAAAGWIFQWTLAAGTHGLPSSFCRHALALCNVLVTDQSRRTGLLLEWSISHISREKVGPCSRGGTVVSTPPSCM